MLRRHFLSGSLYRRTFPTQPLRKSSSICVAVHSDIPPRFDITVNTGSTISDGRVSRIDEPEISSSVSSSDDMVGVFQSLQSLDLLLPPHVIDQALVTPELPSGISPLSLRASLIHYARKLEPNTVIVCLELFADASIPDHLFFKEMGNALVDVVSSMSISDICRLLRAHASVRVTQTDLFCNVYGRLASIINRASMGQIREILLALAALNANLVDCMRMSELCMNRYSLSIKDDSPLEIDRDVLYALAKLGLQNARIIKKATNRFLARPDELALSDLVHAMNSLARLGSDLTPIYKIVKSRLSSQIHPSALVIDLLPSLVSCVEVIDCALILREVRERADSLSRFKSRFSIFGCYLLETEKFQSEMNKMPLDGLRKIDSILRETSEVIEAGSSGCFVKVKAMDLHLSNICDIFNTHLVEMKQPSSSKQRKIE